MTDFFLALVWLVAAKDSEKAVRSAVDCAESREPEDKPEGECRWTGWRYFLDERERREERERAKELENSEQDKEATRWTTYYRPCRR